MDTNKNDGKQVAVEIINVDEIDTVNPKLADTYSEFLKEVNALQVLSGPGLDRTVQNQYRERQDQALKPLELQVTRVRAADLEWKTEMTLAKRDVKVLQAATRSLESI
ncbi:hypothetical protein PG996_005824 [Apiospora saccharicola]|uniref:Uncharacterized protein n=1 Tax=Apiospora saccharicola TaxID=335842 RepID=A0ABR1VMK2_9PEZI